MTLANEGAFQELEAGLSLQYVDDPEFFVEWTDNLPQVSETEKAELDRIKSNFLSQYRRPKQKVLEEAVKLIVVGHLLELAGFYQMPFELSVEESVSIEAEDGETIIKGRLDAPIVHDRLWVVLVESKNSAIDISEGIPQALAYMYTSPNNVDRPTFGLVTNGRNFIFLKLSKAGKPRYAWSNDFSLLNPRHNELYEVLAILKRLGDLIAGDLVMNGARHGF
jgi:predicted type IV restriction endonuclease